MVQPYGLQGGAQEVHSVLLRIYFWESLPRAVEQAAKDQHLYVPLEDMEGHLEHSRVNSQVMAHFAGLPYPRKCRAQPGDVAEARALSTDLPVWPGFTCEARMLSNMLFIPACCRCCERLQASAGCHTLPVCIPELTFAAL